MSKITKIRSLLSSSDIDVILIENGDHCDPNTIYLSGVSMRNSLFLFCENSISVIVSRMNLAEAKERIGALADIWIYDKRGDVPKLLKEILKGKKVGLNMAYATASLLHMLYSLKIKTRSITDLLLSLRAVKTEEEISKIRKAYQIARNLMDEIDIKKGKSELEVRKDLLRLLIEEGLEPAFEPIIAADERSRFPHAEASKKKIDKMVLVDLGIKYEDYCSDITRCFFFESGEKKEQYVKLKGIFERAKEFSKKNMRARTLANFIDTSVVGVVMQKMIHSQGHGIGLDVHEYPYVGLNSKHILKSGNTISLEPAFYCEKYGIRYEDLVIIK
ncbi:MAG: Xaa-Pro peptidase family protein [Candidatus Micrarchaeia archaeon]